MGGVGAIFHLGDPGENGIVLLPANFEKFVEVRNIHLAERDIIGLELF